MDVKPPAGSLAELFSPGNEHRLWVVTGWRGVGKTVWCQNLVGEARKAGLHVSGILTPGRYAGGQRNGIYALRLDNEETRLLASQLPHEIAGLRLGPWSFDAEVFIWGNQYLSALKAQNTDLLIIDELGFLEFDLQEGWMAAFEALSQMKYRAAVVVVRPECIQSFTSLGYQFTTLQVPDPQPSKGKKL